MGRKCSVYGCDGNYRGLPYTRVVKFPADEATRNQWIDAMPNPRSHLEHKKEIWICRWHFTCPFVTVRGGERPSGPPTNFPGIPKTCLKQTQSKPRSTKLATSESRLKQQEEIAKENDKIKSFQEFTRDLPKAHPQFTFRSIGTNDITLFQTDELGKRIVFFVHFQEVCSPVGFIKLVSIEKDGMEIPKKVVGVPKNSLVHRWSQISDIFENSYKYESTNKEILEKVTAFMDCFDSSVKNSTVFPFLLEQLDLLITHKYGRRYDKQVLILAAEIHNISPSAYRMLRRYEVLILPSERLIRSLLSKSFQDENLQLILEKLPPEQRLLNVLFDEVKLKEAQRFSAGHMFGQASDKEGVLAKSALVFEIICHHGGPKYILRIDPVAGLSAPQLKDRIMEVFYKIREKGGLPVSFISDNCAVNKAAYTLLGGIGEVFLEPDGHKAFLTHDYDHIYKNIRNNWFTESTKELSYTYEGEEYTACWKDIELLYKEDRETPVRLTKLNYTAVSPKPLQRQSIELVLKVFHEKTIAAMRSTDLNTRLQFNEGTVIFISLISQWYKMMNVKSKYTHIKKRDDDRKPWTEGCSSFKKLLDICTVVESCKSPTARGRIKKLTQSTANAFIDSTQCNIAAAKYLLSEHSFKYVLPGSVYSQSPLEKFFGKGRMRQAGNFYIDIIDLRAAAKVQCLHQMLKYDIIPQVEGSTACDLCTCEPHATDLEAISGYTLARTQTLLDSTDTLKQKIVYIAGFLSHKHFQQNKHSSDDDEDELVTSEFLEELSRGALRVPTLNMVHLVHCAFNLYENLDASRRSCTKYFRTLLSFVDSPYSCDKAICKRLTNVLFKAEVLHLSDKENELGCLRRREKLQKK